MIHIYILLRNNIPFYVGKTNNLIGRLSDHKLKFGRDIIIESIHITNKDTWRFWENHYIDLFRSWGFNILNKNYGGGGPTEHTQETKNKISQQLKNKPKPEGFKELASKLRTGKKHTPESKQKISDTKTGYKYKVLRKGVNHKKYGTKDSDEVKEKKRQSHLSISQKITKTRKDKGIPKPSVSKALTGVIKSEEHKHSMSLTKLNKPSNNPVKPIYQLSKDGSFIKEWSSIVEASQVLNIKGIPNVLTNRSKSAGGFKWRYK